jgi:hypothetical protein
MQCVITAYILVFQIFKYILLKSHCMYSVTFIFLFFFKLLCWVGVHCGFYKSSYSISDLNSHPPLLSLSSPLTITLSRRTQELSNTRGGLKLMFHCLCQFCEPLSFFVPFLYPSFFKLSSEAGE